MAQYKVLAMSQGAQSRNVRMDMRPQMMGIPHDRDLRGQALGFDGVQGPRLSEFDLPAKINVDTKRRCWELGPSVLLPALAGLFVGIYGRCADAPISSVMCEEPPFGPEMQAVFSITVGALLGYESLVNLIEFFSDRRDSSAQPIERRALLTGLSSERLPPLEKPLSMGAMPWVLTAPYLFTGLENTIDNLMKLCPGLEKYVGCLNQTGQRLHNVHHDVKVDDLVALNKANFSVFMSLLYMNSLIQISGVPYDISLASISMLIVWVYYRIPDSLEAGQWIKRDHTLREQLKADGGRVEDVLALIATSPRCQQERAALQEAYQGLVECVTMPRNILLRVERLQQALQPLVRALDAVKRAESSLDIDKAINDLSFVEAHQRQHGELELKDMETYTFDRLPKVPPYILKSLSNAFMALICHITGPSVIKSVFSEKAGEMTGFVLYDFAIFIPFGSVLDWENQLNTEIGLLPEREGGRYVLDFFSNNLPKLQGVAGSVQSVAIALGDRRIALFCELLNTVLAALRSTATLVEVCQKKKPIIDPSNGDIELQPVRRRDGFQEL